MSSFNILDRSTQVRGPHFLEASAGTGKTFAIEHFVARLILEGEDPLSLDQILVVTFTRAAARELKQRIRATLARLADLLQRGDRSIDYLAALLEQGEGTVMEALRRLHRALVIFDRAQIFTIHGFCHRMLSRFALEAGCALQLANPDRLEHLPWMREAVRDFLCGALYPHRYHPFQLSALLQKYDKDRLSAELIRIAESRPHIAPLPSFSESHRLFQEELQHLPQIETGRFIADYEAVAAQYKQMTTPHFTLQAQQMGEMAEKKICSPEGFAALLKERDHFLEKMHLANLKKRAITPSRLHYPGLFELLRSRIYPVLRGAGNPVHIFLRLAKDFQGYVETLLEQKDFFSPDETLRKMAQALLRPAFAARVRTSLRAAIVDEFQDTDPLQWQILKELFLKSDTASFCLVGDPKQSIYAFRSADVRTFIAAGELLGSERKSFLDTNFRSTPPLVHALNTLFSPRFAGQWLTMSDYRPVQAAGSIPSSVLSGALHFFIAQAERGRSKNWPTVSLEEEELFPFIAQEIKQLQPEMSVAILVKDRYQAQRLHKFLEQSGIQSIVARSSSLLQTPAFISLQRVVEAALYPQDLQKIKRALASPLLDREESVLQGGLENPSLATAKKQFIDLGQILRQRGFGPFFREFMQLFSLVASAELLQSAEMLAAQKEEELLFFFEEINKSDPQEERWRVLRATQGVQIMTIHNSKGLEFDVVFALGLASRFSGNDELITLRTPEGQQLQPQESDPSAAEAALQEQSSEKMRLLYVALTRARQRVYVPVLFEEKGAEKIASAPTELFFRRFPTLEAFLPFLKELQQQCSVVYTLLQPQKIQTVHKNPAPPPIAASPPFNPPLASSERILSFSAVAQKQEKEWEKCSVEKGEGLHAVAAGAETGTAWHAILEKIFVLGLHNPFQRDKIAQIVQRQVRYTPLAGSEKFLVEGIEALLHMPLDGFALVDVAPSQVIAELAFLYTLREKTLLKGFADLFFQCKGRYYLIDWKSNWLGPSDEFYTEAKLRQTMEENDYFLQASLYTAAVQRYVKLFDKRPFEECFGGCLYLFLRANKSYFVKLKGKPI